MRFSLQSGLTLRFGANTYELVRQLEGDEFQFEETKTRRSKIMSRDEIVQGVYSKKYEVVLAVALTGQSNSQDGASSIIDLSALTLRERKSLDRRYEYVKALQRAKVTRGQRQRVGTVITAVSLKLGDESPPSTSAVMKWARDYQTKGGNVIALVDRYRLAPRSKQIPQVLEDTVWKVLKRSYFTRDRHSAKHAFDQLQIEVGKMVKAGEIAVNDAAISYPTLTRRIKDVDLYHRVATREGSARARMVCRTSFPDGYPEYPLQRVEIDHTPLNWVVVVTRHDK